LARSKSSLFILPFLIILLLADLPAQAQTDSTLISSDTLLLPIDSIKPIQKKIIKKPDTLLSAKDSLQVIYFTSSIDSLKLDNFHEFDTSLTYFHQCDPLHFQNKLYATLSNIGLAHKNQVFTPTLLSGYSLEHTSFSEYYYSNHEVKYYNQYQPFTEAFYILGPEKEQDLEVTFSREMFKGFIFGLDFGLNYSPGPSPSSSSPGPYLNNKADDKRLFLTGQYSTKNKRYGVIGNYRYNKLIVLENGGLLYDSIFSENLETDRRVIPVNLMNAKNVVKQSGFYVEQYFNLLKPRTDSVKRKIDAGSISYSFQYLRNQMIYTDINDNLDFYQFHSTIIDSSATYDSIYQQRFSNQFKWTNVGYNDDPFSRLFQLNFGVKYDIVKQTLAYDSLHTYYHQVIPFAGLSMNILKIFRLNVYGNLVIGDYNNGDYLLAATLEQVLGKADNNIGSLKFELNLKGEQPAWYFSSYKSNFYSWNYTFNKQKTLTIAGEYRFKSLSAGAKFFTLGNYTFLDDSIRPKQISTAATLLQLYAQGTIPVKKFGVNTRVVYQTTSQPDAIRLPKFTGTMDIYFKNKIFKKAALLQTGFQVTYFTSYFADAYMPALRNFYIQYEVEIGNFFIADVYLTLEIKRARLFAKYANFNGLFGQYNYFLTPHYPARDARFYFGVSWRFYK
jgi:hypothetical protein